MIGSFCKVITWLVLVIMSFHVRAIELCSPDQESSPVKIAVVYRQGAPEGEELLNTARQKQLQVQACLLDRPYPTVQSGIRIMEMIRKAGEADLILGPTDSGVYLGAQLNGDSYAESKLPVLSPIVATAPPEDGSPWFFQTNLNVIARAETILNVLKRLKVDSVGIVYEDSEFGLQAEDATRSAAGGLDYQAARYTNHNDLSTAVDTMLKSRPAAIGILASRKDFQTVLDTISLKNGFLNPYHPYIFTMIDVRNIRKQDISFVTVGTDKIHEITLLSEFALNDLDKIFSDLRGTGISDAQWADSVREELAGTLERSPLGVSTGSPSVLELKDGMKIDLRDKAEKLSRLGQLALFPENLFRRFGLIPFVNILLIILLVTVLSSQDLRKWNDERTLSTDTRKAIIKICLFNSGIALVVYFFMLLSNMINWSSISSAILVGVGYPALLKSTLMQTKMGESLGLFSRYESILRDMNDAIMELQYRKKKNIIDYIAMTNSPVRMREKLEKIYEYASPARKEELLSDLKKDLEGAKDSIAKRRIYAQRIERRHEWDELIQENFVPDIKADELVGPDEMLQAGLEYCESRGMILADLEKLFTNKNKQQEKRHPELAESDRREVGEWTRHAQTDRGDMRCYLRWLFMKENFKIRNLINLGYLPKDSVNWKKEEWRAHGQRALLEIAEEQEEKQTQDPAAEMNKAQGSKEGPVQEEAFGRQQKQDKLSKLRSVNQ